MLFFRQDPNAHLYRRSWQRVNLEFYVIEANGPLIKLRYGNSKMRLVALAARNALMHAAVSFSDELTTVETS
jgi:hypothetical protein